MVTRANTAEVDGEATALGAHAVLGCDVHETPLQIRCVAGRVWLTEEGRHEDIVLGAGDAFTAAHRGRVVMEALDADASLELRRLFEPPLVRAVRWLLRLFEFER